MPLQLVDFWKRMVQSGLADTSKPPVWAAEYADDHAGEPPADVGELAKWLVQTGRGHKYPITEILQYSSWESEYPSTPILRIAPLTLIADDLTCPFPFRDWQSVEREPVGDQEAPTTGVLRQLDPSKLSADAAARLRSHATVSEESLQSLEILPLRNGPLGQPVVSRRDFAGVLSVLPPGKALSLRSKPRTVARTVEILRPLCQALSALHAAGLVHGELGFDRIWMDASKRWTLLRNPFAGLPSFLSETATLSGTRWLQQSDDAQQFWSPEHLRGGENHVAAVADDIYAMGCLGYALRYGRHAFESTSRERLPSELTDAVSQGASGDPLCRVLAAALASDPSARFATVEQLINALEVASKATPVQATPAIKSDPVAMQKKVIAETKSVAAKQSPESAGEKKTTQPTKQASSTTPATTRESAKPNATAASASTSAGSSGPTKIADKKIADKKIANEAAPSGETKPKSESNTEPKAKPDSSRVEQPKPASQPVALNEETTSDDAKKLGGTSPPTPEPEPTTLPSPVEDVSVKGASDKEAAIKDASVEPSAVERSPQTAEPETPESNDSPQQVSPAVVPARRRRKRKNQKAWYAIYALCLPVLMLVIALAVRDKNPPPVAKRIRPPAPQFIPRVSSDTDKPKPVQPTPRPSRPQPTGIQVVDNDQMLWAPPDLSGGDGQVNRATALLPPGPAAVVTIDWTQLQRLGLMELFEPETKAWMETLNQWSGVAEQSISHVALAWFPGAEGVPEVAAAIRLKDPKSLEELLETWEASAARSKEGHTIYAGDDLDALAYFAMTQGRVATAADDMVDAFAVGSIERIGEVAELEGSPVVLPRLLEELWQSARPNDAIAFLTQPNFLVSDARKWMEATSPTLIPWIRQNLLADCGGVLVRLASAEPDANSTKTPTASYVEVRLAAAPGIDPSKLADPLRAQLSNAPRWAEDFLVTRDIDASWRLLAARLPSMWAFAEENVRTGRSDRKIIWNAYLPPRALPQLTLATLLASNTTSVESTGTAMAGDQTKLTVAQMLDRRMSVSFDQESLQFAVDTIVDEFNGDLPAGNQLPPITIIGGDLQKMGITQNQQIRDFSKSDVPLRRVLTDLVLGANPDRTATGPADLKQALVWVVRSDESEILITTREASKGNYELPEEFVPQPSP
ncbi:serine/threonine protein kinase [Rhodopirellula sp. JC740]|uniref:Serine/threonine protein kinase n=1 Tax=Rhodopirellula halodulae TaxID=2894198 RepID=A0ABS8NCT1_9BACT|nr:serine/threonine protein kinase [Rhodopirellula sp. JC740]MCC9641365.1 serine/threonine protein kinase [Rhodopirellula sp. JC740]